MTAQNDGWRINRYLSAAGFCSRRRADELVAQGRVTIDQALAEPGSKVFKGQVVRVDQKAVLPQDHRTYLLLYKPVGITCTTDRRRRDNIIDFLGYPERVFPVGRLDRDSEGLILLTNDGSIVNRILRQSNQHEKEYRVTVDRPITDDFLERMRAGVPMLGTVAQARRIWREQDTVFRIVLIQGLNRQIRRMCEALGYGVRRLIRVRIMHLTIGSMRPGQWRELTPHEEKKLMAALAQSQSTND